MSSHAKTVFLNLTLTVMKVSFEEKLQIPCRNMFFVCFKLISNYLEFHNFEEKRNLIQTFITA